MASSHAELGAMLLPIQASLGDVGLIDPALITPTSSVKKPIRKRKATPKAAATNKKPRPLQSTVAAGLLGIDQPGGPPPPTSDSTTVDAATNLEVEIDHDNATIKAEPPAGGSAVIITQPDETINLESDSLLVTVDKKNRTFQERITWTHALEEAAINSLIDSIDAGFRPHGTFKTEAWKRAVKAAQAIAPLNMQPLITRERVKQKLDSMKTLWRCWRELSDLSGWGIDDQGRFTAADDVMMAYFKAHPQAKVLSIRPMSFASELTVLYGDTQASGHHARLPGEVGNDSSVLSDLDGEIAQVATPTPAVQGSANRR